MKAQRKAANTARWAVTITKVRIRQALARARWQLVTFCGYRERNQSAVALKKTPGLSALASNEPVCPRLCDIAWNSSHYVLAFKSRGLCLMIVQQLFQQRVQLD
jgi:hypothetical protein